MYLGIPPSHGARCAAVESAKSTTWQNLAPSFTWMHTHLCTCVHVQTDEKSDASRRNPLDDKIWPPRSLGCIHSYLFTCVHVQTDENSNASHVRPRQSKTTRDEQHGFFMRCMHVRTSFLRGGKKALILTCFHVLAKLLKTPRWQIFDLYPHGSVLAFYIVNEDQRST